MLRTSGWPRLLTLFGDADKEDTCDFVSSIKLDFHRPYKFTYRHRQTEYTCTYSELRRVFGWPEDGKIQTINFRNEAALWNGITGHGGYIPSISIAKYIQNPALFYLHFTFGRTIFARKDGNDKVSKSDLAVLHMLLQGEVIDWAWYFCKHLKNLRVKGEVCVGGMVTYFLRARHPNPDLVGHTILRGVHIDYYRLVDGGHIRETTDLRYQWIYHKDPERRPAASPPRQVGRPRRPREEHGLALVDEAGESSNQGAARQEQQWQPWQEPSVEQSQIDVSFNATRQNAMGYSYVLPLPAPPGWRPGDAIPREYLQPYQPPPSSF